MTGKPIAEVALNEARVREIIESRFPDLAGLEVRDADSGWDNAMFRLGERLAARLPRRASAVPLIEKEQRFLPALASRLPVAVPSPTHVGKPGDDFHWPFSVVPWFDGDGADETPVAGSQVEVLVRFLRELHAPAGDDAPINEFRGEPLGAYRQIARERLERVRNIVGKDAQALEDALIRALARPEVDRLIWIHSDLHAQNLVVRDGVIVAVIDWGDLCAGDPALDLMMAWSVFGRAADRRQMLADYGAGSRLRTRALGWAAYLALVLIDSGTVNSPRHARAGVRMLERIAADLQRSDDWW